MPLAYLLGIGYTYGMTMTREAKSGHQLAAVALAEGKPVGWRVLFQSPTVIAEHGGRTRPTVGEYYAIKMHRAQMPVSRLDVKIEIRRTLKCQHRRRAVVR